MGSAVPSRRGGQRGPQLHWGQDKPQAVSHLPRCWEPGPASDNPVLGEARLRVGGRSVERGEHCLR